MMLKVALALLIAAVGCTTLRDVVWPTTVKCLVSPSSSVLERVSAIVARDGLDAVFSADSLTALENAAREFGPDIVVCAIKEIIGKLTLPTGMEAPPENLARARRAQDFLNEHEIDVQESQP
jgi:hypothetical protein